MSVKRKRRSRVEIIFKMLQITKNGATKTHIMCEANLSYKLLSRYLTELLNLELLYVVEDEVRSVKRMIYEVSSDGLDFLKDYEELQNRQKKIAKYLKNV